MATERGVIYYKLDSQFQYDGDITKNCGLTGGEIDSNFHFLRGYDIKSFDVSEDKSELIITRLNGEKMSINVHKELNGYEFAYNKKTGVLSITSPDGSIFDLEGFMTERVFRVYGDSTIDGDGTRYNPISISALAKTGTYSPAKELIDVVSGGSLPTESIGKGERYVTRERISKLGLLYPLAGVMEIQKRLENIGSEWRVPTKADWDQLLNLSENCPQDKNHDDSTNPTNKYLGLTAGENLKAVDFWEPIYKKLTEGEVVIDGERFSLNENGEYVPNENGEYLKIIKSEDRFGFSVYPTGFGDRRGAETIGGFGKWAAFWSSTEEDRHQDMFVKVFSNTESGVEQNSWGRDCYLSLRLVKDYNGANLYDTESIDGYTVPTIYIDANDEDDREKYHQTLVWTKENINFTNPNYGGVESKEWTDHIEDLSYIRYFVNEWDGTTWLKSEIREGESIVLLNEGDVEMHEWRLVNGNFIDTADIIRGELAEDVKEIKGRLDNLESRTSTLETGLADEIKNREDADKALNDRIETLENTTSGLTETVGNLANLLDEEINNREEADKVLEGLIANEEKARKEEDNKLQEQIHKNKVEAGDDSLRVIDGSVNEDGKITGTKISVKLPVNGMIKVDAEGLYIDGDFSFGGNFISQE